MIQNVDTLPADRARGPLPPRDDASARRTLQLAQGELQKWPEGFPGFAAVATLRGRGRLETGAIVVRGDDVETTLADPWVASLLARFAVRVVCERTPCFFKDGDGRYPVTFERAPDGAKQIVVHCEPHPARYRLDGIGRLREIERVEDETLSVTAFQKYARATPGRVLPVSFTVSRWDVRTGALLGYEAITRRDVRVDHVWLPAGGTIDVQQGPDLDRVTIELTDHRVIGRSSCTATRASSIC